MGSPDLPSPGCGRGLGWEVKIVWEGIKRKVLKITDFADWYYLSRYPAVLGGRTTSCNSSLCILLVHLWTPVQWAKALLQVLMLATISQRASCRMSPFCPRGRLTTTSEG